MFSFQAPASDDKKRFEKILGNRTVQSGSISHKSGANQRTNTSTTYSMLGRPLMFADEITTNLKKGDWVLSRIGMKPAHMKLLKYEDWGIAFEEAYHIESRADRKVEYASRDELMTSVRMKYKQHYYPSGSNSSTPTVSPEMKNNNDNQDPDFSEYY